MAHPLDDAIDDVRRDLMASNGPMPLGMVERRGMNLPCFLSVPEDLPRFFEHFCAQHGERIFLVDGEERLSFAQTLTLARRVAQGLIAHHDVSPGDHIALAARNGAGWVIAYMGILMAGGVASLVNGFWTGQAMVEAIAQTGSSLVLADHPRHVALRRAGAEATMRMVRLDLDKPVEQGLAELLVDEGGYELPRPGADAPATILFTSGSTGRAKGALSDHRAKIQAAFNFACSALAIQTLGERMGAPPSRPPVALLGLPLFHVTGEVILLLQSFILGRRIVIMRRWDALTAMRLIEAEQVTYFSGVPLMGMELANHPRRRDFDLSSLSDLAAGGCHRPVDHVARLCEGLSDAEPAFGYGLTETNAVGTGIIRQACRDRPETPGKATPPLSDMAVFGRDGSCLGPNMVGEIGVRSVACISGYWGQAEENAALFTPSGHLLTGDVGYLDEAGYLIIVDRRKDIIIRGGENIACAAVEAAFYAEPEVAECAVFGIADERFGEVPVAAVRLVEGCVLTADDLQDRVANWLAPFERPIAIQLVEQALPRLGSEKIDKGALRDAWIEGALQEFG